MFQNSEVQKYRILTNSGLLAEMARAAETGLHNTGHTMRHLHRHRLGGLPFKMESPNNCSHCDYLPQSALAIPHSPAETLLHVIAHSLSLYSIEDYLGSSLISCLSPTLSQSEL